ncbi:MAG: hypothetical protein IIV74_03235 [Alphaproteobacteria bacterium]|nr:hypothetical protein [Alphaproteobacteria bacterium]
MKTATLFNNSLLFTVFSLFITHATHAATTPWWLQPTVCRLDPTDCYAAMGAGFDSEMWDATSSCWGLKLICPDALTEYSRDAIPMGRAEIARGTKINKDFDTDLLSTDGDCFGRRRTAENGTTASVGGKYVNVWCPGILEKPDETLPNGEITYGNQPTCSQLAEIGYVGVTNGRCYGKYFDTNKYYIECDRELEPSRLIILNGADIGAPANGAPTTKSQADKKFDTMYSTSQGQYKKYFTK